MCYLWTINWRSSKWNLLVDWLKKECLHSGRYWQGCGFFQTKVSWNWNRIMGKRRFESDRWQAQMHSTTSFNIRQNVIRFFCESVIPQIFAAENAEFPHGRGRVDTFTTREHGRLLLELFPITFLFIHIYIYPFNDYYRTVHLPNICIQ